MSLRIKSSQGSDKVNLHVRSASALSEERERDSLWPCLGPSFSLIFSSLKLHLFCENDCALQKMQDNAIFQEKKGNQNLSLGISCPLLHLVPLQNWA